MIARAVAVDRVQVCENGFDPETGVLIASLRTEWCGDGVPEAIDAQEQRSIAYESLGERWLEELSSGRPFQVKARDFTDQERAVLGPRAVKSVLVVPMMVGGAWWGIISFDQCSHERAWDQEAVRMLNIVGSLIASQLDRQRLRISLERAEKRSRLAMQVTGVSVWDCDLETREMFIASEFKETLGFADEEIPNHIDAWLERVHIEDLPGIEETMARIISGNARSFEVEHRMLTKDGEARWFISRGSAIRDTNGNSVRLIGTSTDVTDRKRTESAFRAIFEGSPEGMLLIDMAEGDRKWSILDCNDRAARMHGFARNEVLGRPMRMFLAAPPDATAEATTPARIRAAGVVSGEALHARKDGSTFWCGFQQTILNINGHDRLLVVGHDITERRRHEDERLQSSKLEALGQLAGGIAHDFNNVLTAITGNLSLLRMDLPADTPVKESLDAMDHASARARELAAQLLTFARGGVPIMRATSLADVVNATVHFSSHGSRSKVQVDVAPDLPLVEADEGQISLVLQNLLINAEQAMPDGGVIVVSLDRVDDGDLFNPRASTHLRLRVKDTGHGIPEDIRGRIFDPYFSTKSEGSGLGLATAYSIIRQHHGSISVKSEVGSGTEFTILLPAVEAPPMAASEPAPGKAAKKGRILIMDDEEVIRMLAERGLSRFGYEVVVVKDGEEAITAYEEAMHAGTPFAAVVLDMVIPGGMGGEKTIERLRSIDPDVRGLAMSGYSKSGVMGNPGGFGFKGGLPKPFTLEQFAAAVAKAIGA